MFPQKRHSEGSLPLPNIILMGYSSCMNGVFAGTLADSYCEIIGKGCYQNQMVQTGTYGWLGRKRDIQRVDLLGIWYGLYSLLFRRFSLHDFLMLLGRLFSCISLFAHISHGRESSDSRWHRKGTYIHLSQHGTRGYIGIEFSS